MSRSFSFRDLLRIPELSKFNEITLLAIENDALVNSYLSQLGFNIERPILYMPSKHRDMAGKVAVGFRAVGEISLNRDFLNSRLATTVDRLVATSHYDTSLTKELSKLMGHSTDVVGESESYGSVLPADLQEPDYEYVANLILRLENIRDEIRGNPYNEFGGLKTPKEYEIERNQ